MTYIAQKERVRIVNVFIPKRLHYFPKISEILQAFERPDYIAGIPQVNAYIELHPEHRSHITDQISNIVAGFSISEVDGRYMGSSGPVDERSILICIIIRNSRVPGMPVGEFSDLAQLIVHHLVAGRLATELGSEEELWTTTHDATLFRWIKIKKEDETVKEKRKHISQRWFDAHVLGGGLQGHDEPATALRAFVRFLERGDDGQMNRLEENDGSGDLDSAA